MGTCVSATLPDGYLGRPELRVVEKEYGRQVIVYEGNSIIYTSFGVIIITLS